MRHFQGGLTPPRRAPVDNGDDAPSSAEPGPAGSSTPPPPQRAASSRSTAVSPAPITPAEADKEVASVNARAGLEELQSELEQLREQKQRARQVDREEFETLVAAAAERKAAEQVQKLRSTLEKLRTQNAQLQQELDEMQEQHTMLQDKLHEAQVSSRGPHSDVEAYHMDSVSVVPGGGAREDELGYANAVKRLEDRVLALSRQLSAEHDSRERLEDFLRDKGFSVEHMQLATIGVTNALLRSVRKTVMPSLPPDAPPKALRAALVQLQERCAEAEEGHAASTGAVDGLMRVLTTASVSSRNDPASVMQALPTLAALSATGATARVLLAAGAAAAVGETMLAHMDAPGLLCEACNALTVLAGGLLSPLGMSGAAQEQELRNRDAMCECVATQSGQALLKTGVRQLSSRWVSLAVARTVGVMTRSTAASQRLIALGAVQVLSRCLATYAADEDSYEVAHMTALALTGLAASGPQNADLVDKKGGRAALQTAMSANDALARALGMEFPLMANWLNGRAFVMPKKAAPWFSCGKADDTAEGDVLPQAEALWLATVTQATQRVQDGARPPQARAPAGASSASDVSEARRPASKQAPVGPAARRKPPARPPLPSVASQDEDGDEAEDRRIAMQL